MHNMENFWTLTPIETSLLATMAATLLLQLAYYAFLYAKVSQGKQKKGKEGTAPGKACPPASIIICAKDASQELLEKYPDMGVKERENAIAKEYGTVFIMKIGGKLSDGNKHDGRAPDYDDWNLNGDILFYNDVLQCAFEVSSMGIRVDENSLMKQLKESGDESRINLPYHKNVKEGIYPLTIGGGIGQSRLCMLLLGKAHIGEVHVSVWPEEMVAECKRGGIELL